LLLLWWRQSTRGRLHHPDLAANIDPGGWDFVFDNNDPMDGNGHGTHVAGTVGAVGNNGRGVTGVCWTAKIMLLRVFDAAGTATVADILEAIDYARQNGARSSCQLLRRSSQPRAMELPN
jgi:subtilisin family serine protease